MDELRVLIIADDPLARAGLAMLLAGQLGCQVVGQISGEAEALDALEVYRPDVILWDLGWNGEDSLEKLADLPEVGIPLVALLPDESLAGEARRLGLRSLLLRSVTAEKLTAALQATAHHLEVLEPSLSEALLPDSYAETAPLVEALTPREVEVLHLLAEGLANKAIARRLEISDHTVKFHVNAILSKLGAQSRTEAVVRATRLGLIML
ncbi:MAG: response regulator transcription factor [Anaerolineae bacterium]|nr:response regulator transcription factor [Anaerolineae bacterium]